MDVGGLDEMVLVWLKIVISGVNSVTFGQIERYTFYSTAVSFIKILWNFMIFMKIRISDAKYDIIVSQGDQSDHSIYWFRWPVKYRGDALVMKKFNFGENTYRYVMITIPITFW